MTISVAKYFQGFRRTNDPKSKLAWRPMRQSIADMHLRADVSQKALDRYWCALAAVDDTSTLEELTARVECRVRWKGRSVRAIHPFDPDDYALLKAVHRGEFQINGFRNRDLQPLLYSVPPKTKAEQRKRSAAISRKLRMLRAHGLTKKVNATHRYTLSSHGRDILTAVLATQRITLQQLHKAAA